jgi:hypothetical protein
MVHTKRCNGCFALCRQVVKPDELALDAEWLGRLLGGRIQNVLDDFFLPIGEDLDVGYGSVRTVFFLRRGHHV